MTGVEEAQQEGGGEQVEAPVNGAEVTADGEPTQLEQDIITQIEYYLGDINLPRDKFLQEQLKLEEGWIPFEILIKFHRLAKLSTDPVIIATAVKKSTSGLLEISEDSKKLRRNPEIPLPELNEERRKELTTRTVYVKGFPLDANVDVCLKYFHDYPVVENVVMRRYHDRKTKNYKFKGSVFATFKTREQADNFVKLEGLKYEETELVVKWQEDYLAQKQEEYKALKDKKSNSKKEKKEGQEKTQEPLKLPLGAVLHLTEIPDGVSREQIKQAVVEEGGEVAFVDFNKGDKEGWVRLTEENAAQSLADKLTDSKLKIDEAVITVAVLGGEEETAFLEKTTNQIINRRKNANQNKNNRGRRNHRGGGGGGRKRKNNDGGDGPPRKVQATE